MRKVIAINNNWYYKMNYEAGDEAKNSLDGFEPVLLPHTNIELPYNYFDEKAFAIVSCYKHPVTLSHELKGKRVLIRFEGIMSYARVYLNGIFLGEHKGGYTPFSIRIDEAYNWKQETNILTVIADSTEREDIPPFGGQIDYLTYGGIYREVSMLVIDDIYIENIKIETDAVLESLKKVRLKIYLKNPDKHAADIVFRISIREKEGTDIYKDSFKAALSKESDIYCFEIDGLEDIKLWDVDSPNLYELTAEFEAKDMSDSCTEVFGFRKAEFTPDGFYLNGRRLKLIGLNRHQSFPYVGYAMPKRVQEKDAEILKKDLHLNIVRTSHYPQSKHFLNRCDELGLLVFEEIPGWQHIGDEQWKEVAKSNIIEMIERDWNHPSIILWGVRINESKDDDDFYAATNRIARNLDATRQTAGVRCIANSNLLEDVYTFNDFIHGESELALRNQQAVTGLDQKVPYMVTEYNGHMYPTKRFDNEERQMEHSLRHLRVQNAAFKDDSISGAIGWCAFDYNTHKDFGSGDRICYHGVMDMFRIHKFAAYVYKSQVSPETEPVLEPVTYWARGERSIGGIIPLIIFTNCDYIEFQYGENGTKKRAYPNRKAYEAMPYPPIVIDYSIIKPEEVGAWGMVWEDAHIYGYYKGERVIHKRLCKNPLPSELYVEADDACLNASQKDATRIVVKLLDQYGNLLPFMDEIISIDIKGPLKLQGPDTLVLKGGTAAFWIETYNQAGDAEICIKSASTGEKKVKISIK
ncbi:MAG: glycoside hydrolase family 2 TIM barrel-domain containing protein [Bacillota bacterium]